MTMEPRGAVIRGAFVVAVLAGVVLSSQAQGYPAGKRCLLTVLDASDVVVVGRIESVGDGEPVERQQFGPWGGFASQLQLLLRPATCRVELVLKGRGVEVGASVPLRFLWYYSDRSHSIGLPEYQPGERWLLFLTEVEGHLEPVNPLGFQDLHLPDDYEPPEPNYGLALERTEALLADLLDQYQDAPPAQHPHGWLVTEMLDTVRHGSFLGVAPRGTLSEVGGMVVRDPGFDSAHQLRGPAVRRPSFTTANLVRALKRTSESASDPAIRAYAASILLSAGWTEYFHTLVAAERELRARGDTQDFGALFEIERVTDPILLPSLHQLLFDPDPAYHKHAAHALREIADPSSIPSLVQALDDPAFMVRYLAATGLAAITGDNSHYPAIEPWRAKEADEIAYWKAWYEQWQQEQSEARERE